MKIFFCVEIWVRLRGARSPIFDRPRLLRYCNHDFVFVLCVAVRESDEDFISGISYHTYQFRVRLLFRCGGFIALQSTTTTCMCFLIGNLRCIRNFVQLQWGTTRIVSSDCALLQLVAPPHCIELKLESTVTGWRSLMRQLHPIAYY